MMILLMILTHEDLAHDLNTWWSCSRCRHMMVLYKILTHDDFSQNLNIWWCCSRVKHLMIATKLVWFVSWNRKANIVIKMREIFFYCQHFCYVWCVCVSKDSWQSYRYQMCSSSRRFGPIFIWGRLHTGEYKKKQKEATTIDFKVLLYSWCPFT